MKSLSPNAQEFVPFSNSHSPTPIASNIPLILINNENNKSVPNQSTFTNPHQIIHGYVQPQQQFIPYQPSYEQQQPQTVLAFNNLNDLNNYMFHQKQPVQQQINYPYAQPMISPSQSMSHDIDQIPHHMQTSIIPIQAPTTSFYAFTAPPLIPTNFIDPNLMNQFSQNENVFPIMPNKIQQPKRSFNKMNLKKTFTKTSNFEASNDKDWPSLVNQQKNMKEDDDEFEPVVADNQPKTPYLEDETKLKKLIKNVDFIKKTVERHYNINEGKFSFKDAVLSKPAPIKPKQYTDNKQIETVDTPIVVSKTEVANEVSTADTSEKKHRKRKNKKNLLKKQDTLTDDDKTEKKTFDLNNEDFPDLSTNKNEKTLNQSDHQSDAYSSDATLDAGSLKTSIKKASKQRVETVAATSGKKLHKPIIVEFANMISALEKGGQNDSKNQTNSLKTNKPRSKSQINNTTNKSEQTNKSSIKDMRSLTNPLDSCPAGLKRGKEREKPKQKKPSTLKKIILKEREEKRLLREQSGLNTNAFPLEILDSNNPAQMNSDETKQIETEEKRSKTDEEEEESEESDSDDDENEEEEGESDDDDQNSGKSDSPTETKPEETLINNLAINASNPMSPISQGSPISIGGYTPTTYATLSMLASDRTLLSLEKLEEQVKQKIHNKKFREYCNQITNKEIDEVCHFLLHEIVRFQDRLYHKNPVKAKTKRRYVMGIREVTKHLKLHKLKCVILAPNCEKIQSKGGLDDAINLIIQTAMEQNVPFVFALGRKGLGKAVNKLVPISVVGIFDYSGAEEYFKRLVELANNAKLAYQEIVEEYEKEECENLIIMQTNAVNNLATESNLINNPLLPAPTTGMIPLLNPPNTVLTAPNTHYHHHYTNQQIIQLTHNPIIPSHMGHSRNSSTGSNISIEPFAYHMNYHSHSRSASGNFNFGQANSGQGHVTGHSRSASGGNSSILNIDFSAVNKHWTHSRTPSNCSNISFISRLSEPISEVGSVGTLLISNSGNNLNSFNSASNSNLANFYLSNSNNNLNQINNSSASMAASLAAVQYYTEQVRQEMREQTDSPLFVNQIKDEVKIKENEVVVIKEDTPATNNINTVSSSLVNLHLGCIDEIDAGNEADTEADGELNKDKTKIKPTVISTPNETSES